MALLEKNEEIPYVRSQPSLNNDENFLNTGDDRSSCGPQSSGYRGRIARQVTVKVHRPKDNNFYKVIIPYNFDKKRYLINEKEIEFYENKKYLMEKLTIFNETDSFQIEKDYSPKPLQKLCLYVPTILLCIIFLYLGIVLSAFFSFNIVVMVMLGIWMRKGYNSLQMFKFILLEKFKIKDIHKILNEENTTSFCSNNKLRWILGQSGYWLEIQKLVE